MGTYFPLNTYSPFLHNIVLLLSKYIGLEKQENTKYSFKCSPISENLTYSIL